MIRATRSGTRRRSEKNKRPLIENRTPPSTSGPSTRISSSVPRPARLAGRIVVVAIPHRLPELARDPSLRRAALLFVGAWRLRFRSGKTQ